jgi:hypothetical protein
VRETPEQTLRKKPKEQILGVREDKNNAQQKE